VLVTEEEFFRIARGRGGGRRSESLRPLELSLLIESVGDADPFVSPFADAAAATAAACKSLREAFPRFFRSRAYSHFNAKSKHQKFNLSDPMPQPCFTPKYLLLTDTMLTW